MIRLFSPRLTFTTSNTVLKTSARSVRLSVLRLGERTGKTPKIKFNIGGVEKLNGYPVCPLNVLLTCPV